MRPITLIALNYLRLLAKDRTALVMALLLPLVLSLVTGLAFSGSGPGSYRVVVALVDLDGSNVAQTIAAVFDEYPYALRPVDEEEARRLIAEREAQVAVFIPRGTEESLRRQEPVTLTILRADYQESPRMVEQALTGRLREIRSSVALANLVQLQGVSWEAAFREAMSQWQPSPPVRVEVEAVTRQLDPNIPMGYNLASPGYVVMFGLMLAISGGASSLLNERDGGTLGRLVASPLSRGDILLGKSLGIAGTGILQMSILITLGAVLFGVNWGASLVALVLLVGALSLAATGVGMFLAALCRTSAQASAVGVLSVLVMSMLGGTWWPLEVMPRSMQLLAKVVPSGWAMEGFTRIIMRGAGYGDVLTHVLVLGAFGLVFLSLGIRLFRYH